MKPAIPITDPRFVYRNAACTDVRETWRKAREAMQQQPDAIANVELDVPVPAYEVKPAPVYTMKRREG